MILRCRELKNYAAKPQHFGSTVGRYANRLAGGRFTTEGKGAA